MFAVFRSLHMKLMLILLLLITSLMAVVGAFLTTSVSSFYIDTFYEQISAVFSDDSDGYVSTLRARAAEPEYGPAIPVATASGLRVLPFADIEYLECTHHVVHFHLASGEDVPSLSVRVPFAQVAQPLLADERFVQLHRSYVVNLAAVSQLAAGEFWMQSGARVPVPRGREPAARTALKDYLEKQFR